MRNELESMCVCSGPQQIFQQLHHDMLVHQVLPISRYIVGRQVSVGEAGRVHPVAGSLAVAVDSTGSLGYHWKGQTETDIN